MRLLASRQNVNAWTFTVCCGPIYHPVFAAARELRFESSSLHASNEMG